MINARILPIWSMSSVPNLPASDSLPDAAVAVPAAALAAARACGLQCIEDAWGAQMRPAGAEAPERSAAVLADGALSWLADCSILRVHGDDAMRFLHSQTTNDLLGQAPESARWHGYCSPRGRLLALMLAWHGDDGVRLMLPAGLAQAIHQRLRMFVLRSKVRIADESEAMVAFGLFGRRVPAALGKLGLDAPAPMQLARAEAKFDLPPEQPDLPSSTSEAPVNGDQAGQGAGRYRLTAIGMPAVQVNALAEPTAAVDAGRIAVPVGASEAVNAGAVKEEAATDAATEVQRWLLVVPMAVAEIVWQRLQAELEPVDSRLWRWTTIRGGIASIEPDTSERFVPQMLNLDAEALAAVSFTKGCYPGQEVVARSHYLGKAKRRMFLARIPATEGRAPSEPAPGSDVVDASGRPVGIVVSAATSPAGDVDLLFSGQTDAFEHAPLRIAPPSATEQAPGAPADDAAGPATSASSASGSALQSLPLPYSLPAS